MSKKIISAIFAIVSICLVVLPFFFAGEQFSGMKLDLRVFLDTTSEVTRHALSMWFVAIVTGLVSFAAHKGV